MFSFLENYTLLNGREDQYLKLCSLNKLRYDDMDWSNTTYLKDAFLSLILVEFKWSLEDDIEVDTTFSEVSILFMRDQMPASSTYFDDQCTTLKQLDARR
jgi:hypothetical protein